MLQQTDFAGSFTLSGTTMTVNRMGYGAMQLAGPEVWGPPRKVDAAFGWGRTNGHSKSCADTNALASNR